MIAYLRCLIRGHHEPQREGCCGAEVVRCADCRRELRWSSARRDFVA